MRKFNVLHVTETYWRLVSGCPCLITLLQYTGIIYVGRVGLVCPGHTAQAQWLSPGNLHGNPVRITKDDITKGTSLLLSSQIRNEMTARTQCRL